MTDAGAVEDQVDVCAAGKADGGRGAGVADALKGRSEGLLVSSDGERSGGGGSGAASIGTEQRGSDIVNDDGSELRGAESIIDGDRSLARRDRGRHHKVDELRRNERQRRVEQAASGIGNLQTDPAEGKRQRTEQRGLLVGGEIRAVERNEGIRRNERLSAG